MGGRVLVAAGIALVSLVSACGRGSGTSDSAGPSSVGEPTVSASSKDDVDLLCLKAASDLGLDGEEVTFYIDNIIPDGQSELGTVCDVLLKDGQGVAHIFVPRDGEASLIDG